MADGIDAASFDSYEGIRILIPGALALGLGEGMARTVNADHSGLGLGTFTSFIVALLIGLGFYFVDAPAKATVMQPLRPTDTLFAWNVKPRAGTTTVNLYFVMLDEKIPASIRNRSLYMGSMYRIGFEAIYLLIAASTAMLTLNVWSGKDITSGMHLDPRDVWIAAAFLVGVWLYSTRLDRGERRKEKRATDVRSKHFSRGDLAVLVAVLTIEAALLLAPHLPGKYATTLPTYALMGPTLLLHGFWAVRYFRGYTDRVEGKAVRRPIAATHACLILLAAQLSVLALIAFRPARLTALSDPELRTWLACAVVAQIMVCARGHEKRLRGAYATQNTWLELHKDMIIDAYFEAPKPVDASGDAAAATARATGEVPGWKFWKHG